MIVAVLTVDVVEVHVEILWVVVPLVEVVEEIVLLDVEIQDDWR